MYQVEQSASFECIAETGLTGLVGTMQLQIVDNVGNVVVPPSPLGIIEFPAGSGFYQAVRTAPALIGQYSLVWSTDGLFQTTSTIADDLTVVAAGSGNVLPPIGPPDVGRFGPCNQWTTNEDIALCCSADIGSDIGLFEEVNTAASMTLWELSIRQFSGTCEKTVRPCHTNPGGCSFQVLSRGHIVGGWDSCCWGGVSCGCQPLSQVSLSGYPIREIVEVKIDGAVIDPSYYRLDRWYLTAMNGTRWPGCQRLDLEDTEDGTWSVTYTYGENPPLLGQMAARELACELYKSCAGDIECALPSGVSRIQRQGITIERDAFISWGRATGMWRTGLSVVDAFLNTYNPSGIRRRPVIMTPGRRTYPAPA